MGGGGGKEVSLSCLPPLSINNDHSQMSGSKAILESHLHLKMCTTVVEEAVDHVAYQEGL